MKILFLSDNFPPEVNAPATRTYEHCKEWVEKGANVTVITCTPNFPQGVVYDGFTNRLYQREIIDGINVIRVWSYIAANKGFLKRSIDFISYSISAFIVGLFIKTDIIIATSPQFFTAIAGRKLAFWKGKPWIMEVRDLWPDSIKNVNALKNSYLIRILEKEEIKCYQSAKGIVTVTDTFKEIIIGKGINSSKFAVVKNGANLDLYQPKDKNIELLHKLKLNGKYIIGYIGTHGMAHKLDFVLKSAQKIRDPNIHFLFIGDGAEKKSLLRLSNQLDLTNTTFLDPVKKEDVSDYISIIDIALIPLMKSELFKTVIPSKIFESAAMEKPILLGVDGEARSIIEKYNAGIFFEPENTADFLRKIELIIKETLQTNKFQEGCYNLARDYNRKELAYKMFIYIQELL